jgi:phage gp36-like protein
VAYIDVDDLLDELGENTLVQLTDDEGTGEINEARVLKAIDYASGLFDSYARSRYSLPLPSTPLVRALNLDLAVFHLYKSRSGLPEGVYIVKKNAHDEAVKTLKDIGGGKAALDVPAAEESISNPDNTDTILTNATSTKFSDERLRSY